MKFVVIDLSAGPCTYGKIETEEGSVSYRSMPRLSQIIFPRGLAAPSASSTQDIFIGQLGGLISTTIEHLIAPDIRFETVDMAVRLLIPIIVLQNHNRYNILQEGHNYSIDVQAIEREVGEMERSADVLSAGLLEVANPSLSSRYFLKQNWNSGEDDVKDSIKHRPLWESYMPRNKKERRGTGKKKYGNLYRTYGTRVIPVFVLSLADVDAELLMEEESLVWTSKDVVIVLEHNNDKIPLSYVSETTRQFALPSLAQRHILAGLALAVGGLSAPYERASRIHERPIVNWLWAAGCHPFGPFSNSSQISQILQDVALVMFSALVFNFHEMHNERKNYNLCSSRRRSSQNKRHIREHLKTPLGEPVKGNKNKSTTELWVEKFYKKVTTVPEPFPHDLVEKLEEYLDKLEEQLVDLSSLLYDHRLADAYKNSTDILQSTIFTQQYVERVLANERDRMKCCSIEYSHPKQSSQAFVYGGILLAGFLVYSLVIFFSSPVR
nr:unnamed protein product [Digitaria exilis]